MLYYIGCIHKQCNVDIFYIGSTTDVKITDFFYITCINISCETE